MHRSIHSLPLISANDISIRALIYAHMTKDAHLKFSHKHMTNYQPPKTRIKPNDTLNQYDTETHNSFDGITHVDDYPTQQDYMHNGEQATLTCLTDIDLVGQPDTR